MSEGKKRYSHAIRENWCKTCGICVAYCPKKVLELQVGKVNPARPLMVNRHISLPSLKVRLLDDKQGLSLNSHNRADPSRTSVRAVASSFGLSAKAGTGVPLHACPQLGRLAGVQQCSRAQKHAALLRLFGPVRTRKLSSWSLARPGIDIVAPRAKPDFAGEICR
jgi:ferredoxin